MLPSTPPVAPRVKTAKNSDNGGRPQKAPLRIFPWTNLDESGKHEAIDSTCRQKNDKKYVQTGSGALRSYVAGLNHFDVNHGRTSTLSFELITSRTSLFQDDFLECQRKRHRIVEVHKNEVIYKRVKPSLDDAERKSAKWTVYKETEGKSFDSTRVKTSSNPLKRLYPIWAGSH